MSSPRNFPLSALLAPLLIVGLSSEAYATGFEYLVENQKSTADGDQPVLVLTATGFTERGTVTLSGAQRKLVKLGEMSPGKTIRIPLKVGKGEHEFEVKIASQGVEAEETTISFGFKVVRVEPIVLKVDRDGVNTGSGVIPIHASVPLDFAEITFFDADGNKVGVEVEKFNGQSGDLTIDWDPKGEVGGISIVAYDTHGFWTSVLLEPWFIEIEHEEIIFDFGKASWQPSEEPKLEKSLKEIKAAMEKHAKHRPDMRLYVAGYTDTVGSASKNQTLSAERARAIAQWFKKNGVDLPVYAQGFGETALAVATEDEVAEEKNRRALYMLGNSPPPQSKDIPKASWSRVK